MTITVLEPKSILFSVMVVKQWNTSNLTKGSEVIAVAAMNEERKQLEEFTISQ